MTPRVVSECVCAGNLSGRVSLDVGGERVRGHLEQSTFTSFLRFRRLQGSQDCLIKDIL